MIAVPGHCLSGTAPKSQFGAQLPPSVVDGWLGARRPLLGAGFLVLAAWWTVDLLRGIGRSSAVDTPSGLAAVRAALTAPALASGCTIVMAVGMGAMALMLG